MRGPLHILMIEDRPSDVELVLYELRRSGIATEATVVTTEADYLAQLDNHPDLILADYTLPQFNAIRALQLHQERGLDIPFIVLTGTVSEEIAVQCIKLGAADYLLKDRLTRLGPAIEQALREKQLRDEKRKADEALRVYTRELERLVDERTRELRQAKDHVEAILNNASDAIFLMHLDGSIQQANPAFSRLFGYESDEVFGQSVRILVTPECADRLAEAVGTVGTTNKSVRIELIGRRRDGQVFDADAAFDVVAEEHLLIGSIRDITHRKQMERALQESETRYRLLAENAQDIIYRFRLKPEWHIDYISPAVTTITGYTPDAFYSNQNLIYEIVHPDDRDRLDALLSPSPDGFDEPMLLRWRRRDGNILWTELRNVPIVDGTGQLEAIEGVARDVTQRQHMEEELRKALEKERELNELKSRFVSMVSHEFRTPLAIIQSASDLLKLYADQMPPERRMEQFNEIHLQVKRLTNLLDDILAISRAESIGLSLNARPIDLRHFCSDIAKEIQSTTQAHTIDFTFSGETHEAVVDAKLLRQAISNLLTNAVKYSPPQTTVWFDAENDPSEIRIRVRDEGIGIPDDDQKHLFEVFHRGGNVGLIAGTGLGLAIVKQAVDAHGGTIDIQSRVGQGTCFTIRIPRLS